MGSRANGSPIPRVAASIRYTSPDVKFLMDQWSDPDRIRTFLVRGEDTHHLNDEIRGAAPWEASWRVDAFADQSTPYQPY